MNFRVFRPRRSVSRCLLSLIGLAISLGSVSPAFALDGASPLRVNTFNGWKVFELVTQNNNISSFADVGYSAGGTVNRGSFDGLGTYLSGSTMSIMVNHETSSAAISRVDVNLPNIKQMIARQIDNGVTPAPASIVNGMGYAYDAIYDNTYHAVNTPNPVASGAVGVGAYGNANFNRFCSGTSYLANSFGPGRGFVDQIYMTGEEETGGLFYALDSANRDLWRVQSTGTGSWENAALVDTGNTTHVAMVLSSDTTNDFIRLYVGQKGLDVNGDGSVSFLERNGLSGGTVYFFDPDAGFSATDLPTTPITGKWTTTGTIGVDLREDKLEDIHTNPLDGTKLVFGDQTDGVYGMDLTFSFLGNALDLVNSSVGIHQIYNRNAANIDAPDNVTWTANNKLYVQEDGSNQDMWELNPDGSGLLRIAQGDFGNGEPSGIIDVSAEVGYLPGSIFLTSVQGTPSQLAVLISPNAVRVPEPSTLVLAGVAALFGLALRRRARRQQLPTA